jgi:hypothetical protein
MPESRVSGRSEAPNPEGPEHDAMLSCVMAAAKATLHLTRPDEV